MTEYSLFELAEFWLRAEEEPEDNFSDDVKAAFQLIWDVAFQAGIEEAGFKEGDCKICPGCGKFHGQASHSWVYELCPECKAKERKQNEKANGSSD